MQLIDNFRLPLVLLATVTSALSAGIFFAFSTFVMQALGRQVPVSGIAAMQAINITVYNPWFMGAFFGPIAIGAMLAIAALRHSPQPGGGYWIVGMLVYLVGTIGVTVLGNIPLNEALAVVDPQSAEGASLWARYLTEWTVWNHMRTFAAVVAAISFALSLGQRTGLPN